MTKGFGLALAVSLALAAAGVAARGSADLQWAQQVLKDKGFDVGKPNGEMSQKTRAALSSYQRISNLPVTGELDAGTTASLLASRTQPSGGGQLALPPAPSRAQPQSRDAGAAKPLAAPSARVDVVGAMGDSGVPRAAPSGAVSTLATGGLPGQAPSMAKGREGDEGLSLIVTSSWVRNLVIGVIALFFAGFAVMWWRSGQKPAHRPYGGTVGDLQGRELAAERLEPSFAPSPTPGSRSPPAKGKGLALSRRAGQYSP